MDKAEAIERLEYLKAKAQLALEQEISEWVADDILGTIEAYDMAIEALRKTEPQTDDRCIGCKFTDGENCYCPEDCEVCDRHGYKTEPLRKSNLSEKLTSSEKPNNCETCRHWQTRKDIYDLEDAYCELFYDNAPCHYEPKTEPTGYNLSPVETEPQTDTITFTYTEEEWNEIQDWKDRMWTEAVIEPQTDCGNFANRLAYERGVKHAWEVAQKVFDSTLTFYEAEDVAKQIADTPQTERSE